MTTTETLIKKYNLQRHPEGGWYKENYKSSGVIAAKALPQRFSVDRVFSTVIYFLLDADNFSAFLMSLAKSLNS